MAVFVFAGIDFILIYLAKIILKTNNGFDMSERGSKPFMKKAIIIKSMGLG